MFCMRTDNKRISSFQFFKELKAPLKSNANKNEIQTA